MKIVHSARSVLIDPASGVNVSRHANWWSNTELLKNMTATLRVSFQRWLMADG